MKKVFPTLNSKQLMLRQFSGSDLGFVYQALSDQKVTEFYGVSFKSEEETKEQMAWFDELFRSEAGIWWAVCSWDGEEMIGGVGLNNISKTHKKAEIGFWLLPQYWGRGVMKNAILVVINYAFQQMGVHRIEANVETPNVNCKKLLTKLDFIHEGTMKDCEIKNGNFISLDVYAKVAPE